MALPRDEVKGVSAARTRQGRRSRSSRPLTGSTAGINADTKGAGDEKKAEGEMNTRMKPAQRVACREQASPLSPVAGQSSRRSALDHGFKGRLPRLQWGHEAATETFTAAIGPEPVRNRRQVTKYLCLRDAVSHLKRRDATAISMRNAGKTACSAVELTPVQRGGSTRPAWGAWFIA